MALMEFSMTPLGSGESVSRYVARVVEVIRASGLPFQLNAMGTIVEGELPSLLALLEQCFGELSADCDRVTCIAKFDHRKGAAGSLHGKVESVARIIGTDPTDLRELKKP